MFKYIYAVTLLHNAKVRESQQFNIVISRT